MIGDRYSAGICPSFLRVLAMATASNTCAWVALPNHSVNAGWADVICTPSVRSSTANRVVVDISGGARASLVTGCSALEEELSVAVVVAVVVVVVINFTSTWEASGVCT